MENRVFTGGANVLLELGNLLLLPSGWHSHTSPSAIKTRLEERREGMGQAKEYLKGVLEEESSEDSTLVTKHAFDALRDFGAKLSEKSRLPSCN